MFTWNNPPDDALERLESLVTEGVAKYVVCQLEEGEETHTFLYQCYVEFAAKKSLTACNKLVKGWWAPRAGSQDQAIAYVTKEETRKAGPFHYGEKKAQPKVSSKPCKCSAGCPTIVTTFEYPDYQFVVLSNPE